VLTLQGLQGIGKTSWITSLMPAGPLRDDVIKRDHHMDGGNKDSILGAISHWIVEIGELDGALRKDMPRRKGFLTNDCDKVRPPYGQVAVEYDRRTVFAATVNETSFLVDQTGNRRFWTIAVEKLEFHHTVDMQQVFAQLLVKLGEGAQWWLTMAEEQRLADYNRRHRAVSVIVGRLKEYVDLDRIGEDCGTYMTAIGLLRAIGINQPSNSQCKECGSYLRELLGPPKRVHGRDKWRVPAGERRPTVNLPHEEF
jgi:putative DNA primase/helicase